MTMTTTTTTTTTTAATVIKALPAPWRVGGQDATEVELRPATLDDMVRAELEAHPGTQPIAFGRAMVCQQLLRAGTFTGPFVQGHFKAMPPATWFALRDAAQEADALGEGMPPGLAQPS